MELLDWRATRIEKRSWMCWRKFYLISLFGSNKFFFPHLCLSGSISFFQRCRRPLSFSLEFHFLFYFNTEFFCFFFYFKMPASWISRLLPVEWKDRMVSLTPAKRVLSSHMDRDRGTNRGGAQENKKIFKKKRKTDFSGRRGGIFWHAQHRGPVDCHRSVWRIALIIPPMSATHTTIWRIEDIQVRFLQDLMPSASRNRILPNQKKIEKKKKHPVGGRIPFNFFKQYSIHGQNCFHQRSKEPNGIYMVNSGPVNFKMKSCVPRAQNNTQ